MDLSQRHNQARSIRSLPIQLLSGLTLLIWCTLSFAQAKELSREEWFSNLLKDVGQSICAQEEFKKCHDISEEKCMNRIQSIMLECYSEEIDDIPATIKDPETAVAAVTKLGKCFEPKFSDDVKDYRRKTEECKIPEPEEESAEPVSPDEVPIDENSPDKSPNG